MIDDHLGVQLSCSSRKRVCEQHIRMSAAANQLRYLAVCIRESRVAVSLSTNSHLDRSPLNSGKLDDCVATGLRSTLMLLFSLAIPVSTLAPGPYPRERAESELQAPYFLDPPLVKYKRVDFHLIRLVLLVRIS